MIKFSIVGTSKSKNEDVYYINERMKMWGCLFLSGVLPNYWENIEQFYSNANQSFANKLGFEFKDLVPGIISNDKSINLEDKELFTEIRKCTRELIFSEVKNLLFNGKTAFHLFLFSMVFEEYSLSEFKKFKKFIEAKDSSYGKRNLKDFFLDDHPVLKKNIIVLPNTSSRSKTGFDEFIWIKNLKEISK